LSKLVRPTGGEGRYEKNREMKKKGRRGGEETLEICST
jgi:hypothetical protein